MQLYRAVGVGGAEDGEDEMGSAGEQTEVWNGAGGGSWVRMQATLDTALAAVEELLVEQVVAAAPPTAPRSSRLPRG